MSRSRVLIVDDEENQRSALATMVAAWGYETEMAANGVEALAKLQNFSAHAIVTDLMMPQMDGKQLLSRLGGSIPAIVVTAFGNIETSVNTVRDLGAFWFLEKPIQAHAMRKSLQLPPRIQTRPRMSLQISSA